MADSRDNRRRSSGAALCAVLVVGAGAAPALGQLPAVDAPVAPAAPEITPEPPAAPAEPTRPRVPELPRARELPEVELPVIETPADPDPQRDGAGEGRPGNGNRGRDKPGNGNRVEDRPKKEDRGRDKPGGDDRGGGNSRSERPRLDEPRERPRADHPKVVARPQVPAPRAETPRADSPRSDRPSGPVLGPPTPTAPALRDPPARKPGPTPIGGDRIGPPPGARSAPAAGSGPTRERGADRLAAGPPSPAATRSPADPGSPADSFVILPVRLPEGSAGGGGPAPAEVVAAAAARDTGSDGSSAQAPLLRRLGLDPREARVIFLGDDGHRRTRSQRKLRTLLRKAAGCAQHLSPVERRLVILRVGGGAQRPLSRRETASRLSLSGRQLVRLERAAARELRSLARRPGCSGGSAIIVAASAAGAGTGSPPTQGAAAVPADAPLESGRNAVAGAVESGGSTRSIASGVASDRHDEAGRVIETPLGAFNVGAGDDLGVAIAFAGLAGLAGLAGTVALGARRRRRRSPG